MDIFYGPANTAAADLVQYPQFAVIGDYDGIFTGLPFLLELPGTEPFETASVQMRFSNPLGWQAETRVNQIRLGPETGYGPVIWQRGRMGPVTATSAPDIFVVWNLVPEPSTLALGALGGVALLLRIRKSTKNK